jgi:hypothetical protein
MSATFPIEPNALVHLRNRTDAVLTQGVGGLRPFTLMGHMKGDKLAIHLWRQSGHWREDGVTHALDIVAYYDANGERCAWQGITIEKGKK